MSTHRKLWLGFGTLTAVMVLSMAAIVLQLRAAAAEVITLANHDRQRSEAARQIEINLLGFALNVRTFSQTGDERFRADAESEAVDVERHLAEYRRLAGTEEQRALAAHAEELWKPLLATARGALTASAPTPPLTPAEWVRLDDLRLRMEKFLDHQVQVDAAAVLDARKAAALGKVDAATITGLGMLLAGSLIAVLMSWRVGRSIVRDEREFVMARERLIEQKTLLEALTESVVDGILIVSPEGRMIHQNQTFIDIWNFPPEVLERRSDAAALEWAAGQTADPAGFLARVASVYERPDAEVRDELVMNDGRVYERCGAPIHDGRKRLGWVWTFRDITERKRAERALHESEERFRAIADNMPQLAWMVDGEGRIDWFNKRWLEYTGTTLEDNVGSGWKSVHHPDHVDAVAAKFERALREGTDWEDTFRLRGRDGQYRWFLSRMQAIRNESGKLVRFFGTNTDVTERVEMEAQIKEQTERLAADSKRKDEFLAMLSHELRNPLAPIRAATHLLKAHAEPERESPLQKQAREIIERQVASMSRLINDLLEVSRAISGRIHLSKQTVDLARIVQHAIETTNPHFEQRGHRLVVHACPENVFTSGDPTRLEEVFINLLNNAAKYTPDRGRIEVWCEHGTEAGGEAVAQIRVRDNGIGIDEKLLPHIFDLFTQADRSLARSEGGLGIGLALAYRLVAMHGGTIEVASPPENQTAGSEFIVRLPLVAAPVGVERLEVIDQRMNGAARGVEKARVLVVDDNIDLAAMVAGGLREHGYTVRATHTGAEGLTIARAWRPDVVLLDIGLPEICLLYTSPSPRD